MLYICVFSRPTPKAQSTHERALDLASGADFECNLHYFPNRMRSRGFRGPPWPRRAENRPKKQGPNLCVYLAEGLSSPRVSMGVRFADTGRDNFWGGGQGGSKPKTALLGSRSRE